MIDLTKSADVKLAARGGGMTAADERELAEAVKAAVARVDAGEHPTAAVLAEARDRGLTPGRAKIVCAAYNIGNHLAQKDVNATASDKFGELATADAAEVSRGLAGGGPKTAAVVRETPPPPRLTGFGPPPRPAGVKTAALISIGEVRAASRRWKDPDQARREAAAADAKMAAAADDLAASYRRLVGYFERPVDSRLPSGTVLKTAAAYYGPESLAMVKAACAAAGRAIEAGPEAPFDPAAEPYAALAAFHKSARAFVRAEAETEGKRTKAAASMLAPLLASGLTGAAVRSNILPSTPHNPDANEDAARKKLDDPYHAAELQAIRGRTMLTQLMSDPASPLSTYDPALVVDAYNQMATFAPRSAQERAVVGPWLQRALAGRVEPFELKNISDIERSTQQTRAQSDRDSK